MENQIIPHDESTELVDNEAEIGTFLGQVGLPDDMCAVVTKINTSWKDTTEGVIKTAKFCAVAKDKLRDKHRDLFFQKLNLPPSTFSKLATIGNCKRLHEEDIIGLMSASYTTMYEYAKLTKNSFRKCWTSDW